MRAKIKLCILATSCLIISNNAMALTKCITDVYVKEIFIGHYADPFLQCNDVWNCISFKYDTGPFTNEGVMNIQSNINLNDNNRGIAVLNVLNAALANGLLVNAWSSDDKCLTEKTVDTISIR
ncbi:hypothetical protein [Enterobacter ludwigii]